MVAVAQLVEHLVVVQDVAGSSPVGHPKFGPTQIVRARGVEPPQAKAHRILNPARLPFRHARRV